MRRKDSVNSFDVARLAVELGQSLPGAFVEKAYQPTRDQVLLRLRKPGEGKLDVAIGVGTYVCITKVPRDNPATPPSFATHLRRYLTNARVTGVRQLGFDRVLAIGLAGREGSFELVVELFQNGNVVLVRDGVILHPLVHQSFADRDVRPGRPYVPPPARFDPSTATADELVRRFLATDKDAVRTLALECNLGGQWAEEVLARAGLASSAPAAAVPEAQVRVLYDVLTGLLADIRAQADPCLALEGDAAVDCAPVPLRVWAGVEMRRVATLSEALDALFAPPPAQRETEAAAVVGKAAARLEHRARSIETALAGFRLTESSGRIIGDAVYANFAELEELLARVRELHAVKGWDGVKAAIPMLTMPGGGRVVKADPRDGTLVMRLPTPTGEAVEAPLKMSRSAAENARSHYEAGKKAREKMAGADAALAATKAELAKLHAKGAAIEQRIEERTTRQATKRFWFDGFRWFVSSTGHLVVGGRDAKSNEALVKKHLENHDRYVHADVHGAPSVIVKGTGEGEVPDAALQEAGQFAVAFSRAWSSGVAAGEAYWVLPSQVSRTPEAGEYLAKGAFIIRGKRTFIRAGIEAAVGEVEHEGHRKVMGGPPAALEARSRRYVVLRPGEVDANSIAAKLAKHFLVPLEELQRVLPPGPCHVVRVVGIPPGVLA